ncbi:MAG: lysophospholipase [Solirubrobacteraceae bacterium]
MNHRTGTLPGAGGRRIFWQSWTPAAGVRAVVVIVHGAGEHSGRYEQVAGRLTQEGYAGFALDHRGHGRSDGPRALIDRMSAAVADLDSLIDLAGAEHPDAPVFVLGHSMGGTIAVQYALSHQDRMAGLILSGPLAEIDAPAAMRAAGRALSVLAPRLPLIGVDPGLVSRDPEVVAAYRSDPLVHHGKLPARTVAELTAAIDAFPARAPEIIVPTLIVYGTADRLCPPSGSVMLGERIGADDLTLRSYDGLYHEVLNEPERERVLDDVCAWLGQRVTTTETPGPTSRTA